MTTDLSRLAATVPARWTVAAVLLVFFPWVSAGLLVTDYDAQRIFQIAAFVCLVGIVVTVRSVREACLRTWGGLPTWATSGALAVVGIGCLSALAAPRPTYALAEVASFVMIGVVAVAAASVGRDEARRGMGLVAILALGGYAAIVLGHHAVDVWRGASETWPYRHLGFGHMRHFNQMQAWTLPLVWALAAASRPASAARAGLRVLAAVHAALVVASFGRGIVVALVAGVVVSTIVSRRGALLREAALSAASGVALWAILFTSGTTVADRLGSGSNGRAELWAAALRMIEAHPLLGVGPMHYAYYPNTLGAHPHNVVLQVAAEWGLPAAALAGALVLAAGVRWLRHARRASALETPDALWTAGLTAALTAALANALVDGFVIAPVSQVVAGLAIGALLAAASAGRRPARPVSLAASVPLGATVCASLAVLVAVVSSDLPGLGQAHGDLQSSHDGSVDTPRFWFYGKIAARIPEDTARFWPEVKAPAPGPLVSR